MKKIFGILCVLSITFSACSQNKNAIYKINDYVQNKGYETYEVATFAGGCFWCTEAAFERINGVVDVISGYAGGEEEYPTYEDIGYGRTGHTESIQIYYDPQVITFEKLLEVFFVAHDPTQVNRQGPDVGTQYRSAIFYHNDEQKTAVETFFAKVKGDFKKPIATEVSAYTEFWVAEDYHQNYYELHPDNPYVANVSKKKVEKVKKVFKSILKKKYQ